MIRINKLIVTVKRNLHFTENFCSNKCDCGFLNRPFNSCVLFDETLNKDEKSTEISRHLKCKELFGKSESCIMMDLIDEQ